MRKQVKVTQEKDDVVPTEVLAKEILAISAGVKRLRSGKLNDRALVLLIQHASPNVGSGFKSKPMTAAAVRAVLEGLEGLAATYLRKPQPKK